MVRVVILASVRVIPQGDEAMPGCWCAAAFIFVETGRRLALNMVNFNILPSHK